MPPRLNRWLLVAFAAGLAGVLAGWFLISRLGSPSSGIERTADPPAVVRQIREMSELVTVNYVVQKVVGLEEQKFPFGSERLLLIVQAEVLGGVDLEQLREEDVARTSDGGVRIALPAPRILHVVLDDNETKVWDREITWWTPWVPPNPDLERQARLSAIESVKEAAFKMGIHRDARRNAEETIRRLLRAMGVETVTFVPSS